MKDFILEYSIPDTNLFKDKVESHMEDLIRDFNRGIIYTYYVLGRYNFECKRDYKYSEQLLKEGSKRGLDLCMLYLAKMYEVNAIKTNNKDRDIYYCYENAAKKGNVEAKEWIETHFYDNDTKKF